MRNGIFITFEGPDGSGKTTICDILSREYNFRRVHAGGIFRQLGVEKNISVLDMTKELTAKGENEVDKLIDQKMIEEFNSFIASGKAVKVDPSTYKYSSKLNEK